MVPGVSGGEGVKALIAYLFGWLNALTFVLASTTTPDQAMANIGAWLRLMR